MHTRLLLVLTLASTTLAQDPQPLILPGHVLATGETVVAAGLVAVNNHGVALVGATTDNPNSAIDSVYLRDGIVVLRQGDTTSLPSGVSIELFRSSSLNINGDSGWTFKLAGTSSVFEDSGVFFNGNIAIQAGAISTAPEFSPSTRYRKLHRATINDSNQILVVTTVDDPGLPTENDPALMRIDLDGNGSVIGESAVFKEGDLAPGAAGATITSFGARTHQVVINKRGDVMFTAFLSGGISDQAVYINSTPVALSGTPSPVPGRNWGCIGLSGGFDMNNVGDYVVMSTLDGFGPGNFVIVKNGEVFQQAGQSLPSIGGVVPITGFGKRLSINDRGEVLWTGRWQDPPISGQLYLGLFLDDELLVQTDVTTIDGRLITHLQAIGDHCDMSRNGRYIVFTATPQPPPTSPSYGGVYMIEREFLGLSYCPAAVNSTGISASLSAVGSPHLVDQDVTLMGQGLPGSVSGLFLFGPDQAQVPLADGLLCVGGAVVSVAPVLKTDPSGVATRQLNFNAPYAASLAPGTANFQLWYRDPMGPGGAGSNLSSGLEVLFQ